MAKHNSHVNRLKQTVVGARGWEAEQKLNALLENQNSRMKVRDGSLDVVEPESVENIDRSSQICLEVVQRNGLSVTLPWLHFQRGVFHKTRDSEVFLELVFTFDNILIFGRGLREVWAFIKFEAVAAVEEARFDDDGEDGVYISNILVITGGDGQSLFETDADDRRTFIDFLGQNPGLSLRPETEEGLLSDGALLHGPAEIVALEHSSEEEVGGHPRHVEETRRGAQHKHRTKEIKTANLQGRRLDPSKLRH